MLDSLFTTPNAWFSIPALLGTMVFVLKLAGLLLGGDTGELGDAGEIDLDALDADGPDADSVDSFKLFSIQSIAAFAMGAGWAGFTGLTTFGWELAPSLLLAAGGGAAMLWLLAACLRALGRLRESGNITPDRAVGREGTIEVAVPAANDGRGRVRVIIDDRAREYNAVTHSPEPIPSRTRVIVVGLGDDHALIVQAP